MTTHLSLEFKKIKNPLPVLLSSLSSGSEERPIHTSSWMIQL